MKNNDDSEKYTTFSEWKEATITTELSENAKCKQCGFRRYVNWFEPYGEIIVEGSVVCKRCYSEFIRKNCGMMGGLYEDA